MDCDGQRKAKRIDNDVFFPALNLLISIYTTVGINMMGCLYTPGIHDTKTWIFLPSHLFTNESVQSVHHLFKHCMRIQELLNINNSKNRC